MHYIEEVKGVQQVLDQEEEIVDGGVEDLQAALIDRKQGDSVTLKVWNAGKTRDVKVTLDATAFPAVGLAKDAARQGSTFPAVFNAANEEAVMAFHAGRIGFLSILETVEAIVDAHAEPAGELTVESLQEVEREARASADRLIATLSHG